jgi:hypothetical protein
MDSLISQDGNVGEIPLLINRMLADGSKVVFMQYPEIPADAQFGFAACDDEFTEMTFRLNQFAPIPQRHKGHWAIHRANHFE